MIINTAKISPAMAAARGVLSPRFDIWDFWSAMIVYSWVRDI
jgi:hypothetical protein